MKTKRLVDGHFQEFSDFKKNKRKERKREEIGSISVENVFTDLKMLTTEAM